ncbi:DUF4190 domain-containing protein [Salinibacterium sp. UTAS2018]|uniref:DUF4190 domain-containing protein n=1 Tax=Salinibacterium sp. UTAS2018 TaxID=2508880 RepID=UPI00100975EF|nr:DUF4190 domain-containing protein [Salinibacterium sp. UTAS2018]QAV69634.1 DUF4190 domain-containing protein [Salinibacterium sp. UTAS2018]
MTSSTLSVSSATDERTATDVPTSTDVPTATNEYTTASAPRAAASRTMSVLALSLGIASLFFAQSVVVPLAAVILGVFGLRDEPTGRGFSIWGIVLACVATFGWVLVVIAGALATLPFLLLAAAF